jgi:CubicO group peptidase (beta-lactamase class C family)
MDENWDKRKVAGNKDIIEYLNKYTPPKLFEPGTQYLYSNTGYVLLGSITEKVSGRDFIEFCKTEIFDKLGMKNTAIRTLAEKALIKNFALGHVYVEDRKEYIRADSFPSSNYTIWLGNRKGPGRISSTVEDLLKWDRLLSSKLYLNDSMLQQAYQPYSNEHAGIRNYGLGWRMYNYPDGYKIIYHNGWWHGSNAVFIRLIKEDATIIVIGNKYNSNIYKARDLISLFIQHNVDVREDE